MIFRGTSRLTLNFKEMKLHEYKGGFSIILYNNTLLNDLRVFWGYYIIEWKSGSDNRCKYYFKKKLSTVNILIFNQIKLFVYMYFESDYM